MAHPSFPQFPFAALEGFFQNASVPWNPPAWAVEEGQRRVILLLNHVLQQEPEAMQRLARQKGQIVLAQWRSFTFRLAITPAGLLDLADVDKKPSLTLTITQESPIAVAQTLVQGGKPDVRIEGDVQLAAEINWLADHVRWDIEEDLSRIVGDVAAHTVVQACRTAAQALQHFASRFKTSPSTGPAA